MKFRQAKVRRPLTSPNLQLPQQRTLSAPHRSAILALHPGGPARLTEPQEFSWEVVELLEPGLRLAYERRYEDTGLGINRSVLDAIPFDAAAPDHPGVLVTRLVTSR